MSNLDEFGFSHPVILNAPPESVTADLIKTGAISNKHISNDALIDQSKIKSLLRDLKSKMNLDGSSRLAGSLDLGNNIIKNVGLPVEDNHATNKKYVDDALASGGLGYTPINKAGDAMTGLLELFGDPVSNLQAATKQYVDHKLDSLGSGGDVFRTGNNVLSGNNTFGPLVTLTNGFSASGTSDLIGSLDITGSLNLSGSLLLDTGSLLRLGKDPVANLDAATKQYVDGSIAGLNIGDVFTVGNNTLSGNNIFSGSLTLSNTSNLDIQGTAFFHKVIEATSGLNIQGPVSLSDTSSITDIFGSVINLHSPIIVSTGQSLTLSKSPEADLEAATKKYVDDSVNAHLSLDLIKVESLTHLPITTVEGKMAFVESLAALYIYASAINTWIPYQINFYPNWEVLASGVEVSIDVMGNDAPTILEVTPTGTTRFYLYRRSDNQIDIETTIPDMYNGVPGIIESAGSLQFVKPYIGSVVSSGTGLVKEAKVGKKVSQLETLSFAPIATSNTTFVTYSLVGLLPSTSNKADMMVRLILPNGTGPDLELYTRPLGSGLVTGRLSAGLWSQSGSFPIGSYEDFTVNTNDSKAFEYRFNRVLSSTCNFYFLGYEEII
jgi:hypothetical protein